MWFLPSANDPANQWKKLQLGAILSNLVRKGFTLIEILVIVTVTGILLGGGLAVYSRFNEKQQVRNAAQETTEFLRTIQKRATAGDKPAGCSQLDGYRVIVTSGTNTAQAQAICLGVGTGPLISSTAFKANVLFTNSLTFNFEVLTGIPDNGSGPVVGQGGTTEYVRLASIGPVVSVPFYNVIANGATNQTCDQLCITIPGATCASVGTDPNGTDSNVRGRGPSPQFLCFDIPVGNCGMQMIAQPNCFIGGVPYTTNFTNCRCQLP